MAAHLPAVARPRRGRAECRSAGVGGNDRHMVWRLADAAGLGYDVAGTSTPRLTAFMDSQCMQQLLLPRLWVRRSLGDA